MPPFLIDFRDDYAFKNRFGVVENVHLLVHFLNAMLRLRVPIVDARYLNPISEREHREDKRSILDIKALDQLSRTFQVEVQVQRHDALPLRALFNWSDIFRRQLTRGRDYDELRPVHSIWLLDHVIWPDDARCHHHFQLQRDDGLLLTDRCAIHLVELPKWQVNPSDLDDADRWVYFLKYAGQWNELPDFLDTPELRQAMAVRNRLLDLGEDFWRQRAIEEQEHLEATYRKEALRLREEIAQLEAEKQRAEAEKQRAEAEKQRAEAEKQRAEAEKQKTEAEKEQAEAERAALAAENARLRAQLAQAPER